MSPFESMAHATVYITITVFAFLLLSTRKNPLLIAGTFVHEVFTSKKHALHLMAVLTILLFNKLELWVEKRIDYRADFTEAIYRLEGDFVVAIQQMFNNDLLTYISSYFYVIIFPAVMIGSLIIYTFQKNEKLFYAVCYALMLNYMLAIPFYLFFPVNEVWYYHSNVDLLIEQVFPTFEQDYRPLSGLDNCLPSLHTSLSVSMAVLATKSGNTFWKLFVPLSSAFILFTILYLGIHWLADLSAGVLLGVFAARFALRISEGRLVLGERALLKAYEKKQG